MQTSEFDQAKADRECPFDMAHRLGGHATEPANEAFAVNGPELVEKHDGVVLKATFGRPDQDFGRIQARVELGRKGGDDCDWTEAVGDVVLQN